MSDEAERTLIESSPHCRALEARIAELEGQLAAARGTPSAVALTALRIAADGWGEGRGLGPSPARRHWMDQSPYAYQCLPLVIANQWGWQVLCPADVRVAWDGSPDRKGVSVEVDPKYAAVIKSQFGSGIVTFSPPWLFRTSPGWDLYAKGPGNRWKANAAPLEGVIETWWLNYTFTLNWKVVEPGMVVFSRGESLGQLVPVPHATFRDAEAIEAPINFVEPEAATELVRWLAERRRIAQAPVNTHKLYLKAEGIEDHLSKVLVPPVVRTWGPDQIPHEPEPAP
jgi:hypothetical protein